MPPKKVTPKGKAARPAGEGATATRKPAAKKAATTTRKPSSTKKHIRNIRGVDVRLTFESGRRVQLAPRGMRGDMTAVSKDELDDPIFLNNLGILYEVLAAKDADEVREKQNINASTRTVRPEDLLTNEKGESMSEVTLEGSYESQGKTIATLETTDGGTHEEKSIDVVRNTVGPRIAVVPGSDGKNYYS